MSTQAANEMHETRYHEALDAVAEILGEETTGEGLVAEIRLIGQQRDEARATLRRMREVVVSDQLQVDIAAAVARIEQAVREPNMAEFLLDRLATCDAPRLRSYLGPETLASLGSTPEGDGR